MKALLKYPLAIFLFIVAASCSEDDGRQASYFSELPAFDEIQVNDVFHICLKQDTTFSIQIIGHENIIDGVKYDIENGVLTLTNESAGLWLWPVHHKVEVHISSDSLQKVSVNETSFIETVNPIITDEFGLVTGNKYAEARLELNCRIFYCWNNFPCGGKITLEGYAQYLHIWNYVIMSVDAGELETSHTLVENYSKGDCIVNVKDKLEYSIHGIGNIYLLGNPPEIVLLEKTSTGELIRVE